MLLLSSLILAVLPSAFGFNFNVQTSALTECGSMDIVWSGGSAPYTLTIIPAFDYPTNLTLPASAFSNGVGSYSWQVNYPEGVQMVFMMGDSTGTGAGGVSDVFKIGSGNTGCTLRSTQTDFMFYLNETSVTQCDPVEVYWDESAVAPVRVLGVIPQGQIFEFSSIGAAASMVWNTNIAAGTSFILAAFNSGPYGNGGSSALMTVGSSSNSGCLDDSSPSSTPAAPVQTGTGTTTSGPTRTGGGIKTVTAIATAQPSGAAGLSGGAIAGIVAGVVVVVLILQAILIWFCCRRQLLALVSHRKQMRGREVKRGGDVDLISQLGDPNDVILDDTRTNARHTHSGSDYTALNTAVTRESIGGGYPQSSISPFWDDNRVSQAQYASDFDPPHRLHTRDNSFGSTPELPDTSSAHSPSSPLVGPYFSNSASGSRQTNSNSLSSMSKAQLASSFAPTNPDRDEHRLGVGLEDRLPPLAAPSGGFVREQDAGSLDGGETREDTEHLPPMYDPQWQTQNGRRER